MKRLYWLLIGVDWETAGHDEENEPCTKTCRACFRTYNPDVYSGCPEGCDDASDEYDDAQEAV